MEKTNEELWEGSPRLTVVVLPGAGGEKITLGEVLKRAEISVKPHLYDESPDVLARILSGERSDCRIHAVERTSGGLEAMMIQQVPISKQIKHGGWVTCMDHQLVKVSLKLGSIDQLGVRSGFIPRKISRKRRREAPQPIAVAMSANSRKALGAQHWRWHRRERYGF